MKKLALCFLLASLGHLMSAQYISEDKEQEKKKGAWKDKITLSGGVQLSFGTFTAIGATPRVGYRLTKTTVAGVGVDYIYFRQRFQNGISESSTAGASVFARQVITDEIFLMSEFNRSRFRSITFDQNRWFNQLLVGGGYRQQVSGNFSIGLMVLFDVLRDPNNPYQNPIVRGGGFFGL